MTTNGVLLADAIDGLRRRPRPGQRQPGQPRPRALRHPHARRRDLDRVLAGLAACERHPSLRPIKVNAVALRGLSEPDVLPLAELARHRPYVVRFIEVMPLDAPRTWTKDMVLSGEELRGMIRRAGRSSRPGASAPPPRARAGASPTARGAAVRRLGTEPFCAACNRLRLTADGQLRTCLFAETETDLRGPLRAGADDDELEAIIRGAVAARARATASPTPSGPTPGGP